MRILCKETGAQLQNILAIYMVYITNPKRGWGSGKWFGPKKGSVGEKV
jgi:hypothetical protein